MTLTRSTVGDLFLTCSSTSSRNYTVGKRLGEGEDLQHILDTLGSVAEGVATASALHDMLETMPTISAPIAHGVWEMTKGRAAKDVAIDLLEQPMTDEGDFEVPDVSEGKAQKFKELVGLHG